MTTQTQGLRRSKHRIKLTKLNHKIARDQLTDREDMASTTNSYASRVPKPWGTNTDVESDMRLDQRVWGYLRGNEMRAVACSSTAKFQSAAAAAAALAAAEGRVE